ncbi:uncharacterized protein EI90DRAFT_1708641 [Cantharellus anzutake]|uniref:uncharacterized protein n=1 Tax=Cantharellus anzutake TaxID=1750568 RepID=UPI001905A6D8|nr:uncharacterized protein EI90DRAFT_1708641 [Cantharellus anzutake]KAF8341250.1 hypothetical protein EI90DRAFT_1708641 [Cantharellus anzutake]
MIGMALRWCIRNFYRETRDTVELGVTIREAKHQKVASEDSSHSNRSSVAPDIYEGTYANVSMDENINVDNNTARTLPRRGGHEEEEGLLESRTASSSRHLSVSSDISLGRAPTSTKPSGPRGPRNSITSSAAHSPRRSSILSDPRALRNSIASSPPQSPGSSFILSDPRVPRDSIASSASQSPRSSFILSDPRALRDSIASSASQSRSSFILSDPRSHRNSISPGPLIFSSGGGSGSYAVVPLDDHDN